jgi:ADP-heptose:LPS heptosyltransferase
MGYGDYIMLSGQVRELKSLFGNVKIVCPDGERTGFFDDIFKNNPYISRTSEISANEAVIQLPRVDVGVRNEAKARLDWKKGFQAIKGDLFLDKKSLQFGKKAIRKHLKKTDKNVVIITPYAKRGVVMVDGRIVAYDHYQNKEWGVDKYDALIEAMPNTAFIRPVALGDTTPFLDRVIDVECSYLEACGVIANADAYLGCEGGQHHAAAALTKPAVVIFGGWISPITTGYSFQSNMYVGKMDYACGSLKVCDHCLDAMARITVEHVKSALEYELMKS